MKTITYSTKFKVTPFGITFTRLLLFIAFIFSAQISFAQKSWDGGGDGVNWSSGNNWSPNGVPGSTDAVTIGNGFAVSLNTSTTVASLTVGGGTSGSLTIGSGNTNYTLTVTGAVTVNAGATITSTGNGGNILNIGGNLSNAGTFSDNGGDMAVAFNGSAQTISGAGSFSFTDFLISAAGTKTINSNITVASDWTNNGGTVAGTGTVTLSGTGTIGGTTTTAFPNLTVSGTITQAINTSVTGNYSQTGGTYNQNIGATAYSLTVTGNFSMSGSSVFNMQTSGSGLGAMTTVNGSTGTTLSGTARIAMDSGGAPAANISVFQTTNFTSSSTANSGTGIIDFGNEGSTKNNQFRVSGNFTKTGTTGRFYTSAIVVNGGLVFNGAGSTQIVSIAAFVDASRTEYYNVTVNSGAVVQLASALTLGTENSPTSSMTVNGTLDTQALSPAVLGGTSGTFTLASGATLKTANPNGIVSTTTGSISTSIGTRTFNAAANYIFSGSANQTTNFSNSNIQNLTIANTAGTVTLNTAITASGNLTINSGASLNASFFNHSVAGNWTNNGGTFVPGTGAINLNGTSQTVGGTSSILNFDILTLSGGTKSFVKPLSAINLTINAGALADFGSLTTHATDVLTLGGYGTAAAKFGSTSTTATSPVYKNNTYFTAGTTGYITVGTSGCSSPTITFGTIPSICPGAVSYTIPYTATTGLPDLYTISGSGITTVINGALASAPASITVGLSSAAVPGVISTGSFNVSSSVTGCVSTNLNGSVTVSSEVGTPSFIAGATTICQDAANTAYTATATAATGITYSVSPGSAGTIGTSSGIMNWNAAFSGTATITASAAGCAGPKTADRIVTVTPTVGTPSTPSPEGTTICQGSTDTIYTTSATNATSYTWSVTGTGNSISGTGTTGTVTWSPAFSGSATVSVRANGCNGPSSLISTTVTVTPTVGTPSFTNGGTNLCQDAPNETYTATAINNTGITYSVSPAAAGTIGSGNGIMDWDPDFSGTAIITATATGCSGPKTANRTVTVTPTLGALAFTAGAVTVCQNAANETYAATAAAATGITYSVSPAAAGTIGSISGIMDWNPAFIGTATITASASGCSGPATANRVVTVNALPIVMASDVSGCDGTSIALSGQGTPTGGSGNYSVANPYVGSISTTYTYTYTDLNGCSATSAPANIIITPQPLWYADVDGDQYYTGSATASCTSPGAGYTTNVLGGGDCNDADAAINPGAAEICYNNIDDNCDGTLSEGCTPVVVNMTPSYNNSTLPSLSTAVPAIAYDYPASNLKYRFSITNATTNTTAPDIIQTSRYVTIPAVIHSYNSQYTIKVSAVINEEVVAFAGNTITVNSPAIQMITLNTVNCGATLNALTSTIAANPGLNATGYTFRIRLNDANPTPTYAYSQSATRFVGANSFTGSPLKYSTSYKVSVQYTSTDPSTNLPVQSGYGAECTVNTPSIPLTNLASPTCGSQVATMNANISAAAASYATAYQFRIRLLSDNGPAPTYYYSVPNASRFSSLTAFQGITLAYNTNYAISVQYSILNGASTEWSGYGAECSVKTPFFPVTGLIPSQCGLATPTSLTQQLNISPYPGFPHYKVKLEEIDGEDVVNFEEKEITYSHFKLSDFAIAQLDKVYNISVAIKLNGVFGDYDTACDVYTESESSGKTAITLPFKAVAYPNPFANNFMLNIKTDSQSSVNLKVYDMVGRLIEQRDVRVSDMQTTTIGNQYPSGVYNVIVSQDDAVETVRVVKR
jgi:hypothetical protein